MNPHRKSPEEALRQAADALGGLQCAGHLLQPDKDPAIAGHWLGHCLTSTKRDKLALSQIVMLFRRAGLLGAHDGFATFAACCGYAATPITPEAEFAAALKRAETIKAEACRAAADLETLLDNPELLARMQAAGLKLGELA
jgi:hypothetical protein